MASEKILNEKKQEVKELSEKMAKAKLVLLVDYKGINVADVTSVRSKVRATSAEYRVIKNNITRRALEANKIEGLSDVLEGTTAVILGYEDYLEPLKAIYEFAKNSEFYKIKGGIIEGKVVSVEELLTLAKLPSRETLIAQLAGALLGNISKLAVALNEVSKQKEAANA